MRYSIDVMEFGLTVAVLTVVDEPSQAVGFLCGIHTDVRAKRKKKSKQIVLTCKINVASLNINRHSQFQNIFHTNTNPVPSQH